MTRSAVRFTWTLVRNPPINFGDDHLERWPRRDVWSLRPPSMRSWFTRREPCGCVRRYITGHHTMWCLKHSGFDIGDDE